MSEILKDFTVVEEVPVRWGDMDARGHVNNAIYYRYFEMSRIALYHYLNIYEEPAKVRIGPILSFQSCHYKAPLTFPDIVYVGAKIINIEDSKIVIKHTLVSKNLKRKAAEGESHVIWYDYETQKKAPISEPLRKRLLKS
jgi:acyl-CoA thioester hydrolase